MQEQICSKQNKWISRKEREKEKERRYINGKASVKKKNQCMKEISGIIKARISWVLNLVITHQDKGASKCYKLCHHQQPGKQMGYENITENETAANCKTM